MGKPHVFHEVKFISLTGHHVVEDHVLPNNIFNQIKPWWEERQFRVWVWLSTFIGNVKTWQSWIRFQNFFGNFIVSYNLKGWDPLPGRQKILILLIETLGAVRVPFIQRCFIFGNIQEARPRDKKDRSLLHSLLLQVARVQFKTQSLLLSLKYQHCCSKGLWSAC